MQLLQDKQPKAMAYGFAPHRPRCRFRFKILSHRTNAKWICLVVLPYPKHQRQVRYLYWPGCCPVTSFLPVPPQAGQVVNVSRSVDGHAFWASIWELESVRSLPMHWAKNKRLEGAI
jgi:hypothetical protein